LQLFHFSTSTSTSCHSLTASLPEPPTRCLRLHALLSAMPFSARLGSSCVDPRPHAWSMCSACFCTNTGHRTPTILLPESSTLGLRLGPLLIAHALSTSPPLSYERGTPACSYERDTPACRAVSQLSATCDCFIDFRDRNFYFPNPPLLGFGLAPFPPPMPFPPPVPFPALPAAAAGAGGAIS